ncbi:transfer complex protein TrsK-like protein [Tolypothrix tenuis PCC 7101]|uniref:Transfer complex protein TrsK-like protein n=1 Tax=Tolypothrix tenuis PCC 7101 TaxID=231146 RepID=A0A1Z4N431_9CYAN|nr:type IV secretion system DNA-binding domain-containing protein [Aulosira sp. FACHB-113]BAZ00499.1 transfer complex protein TrsK-like protein [Tolypothrix tenuis PCC 7101]BAZ75579.1 transfer complex protein TrsK-like protein [Aulosira laxa NIES-50]
MQRYGRGEMNSPRTHQLKRVNPAQYPPRRQQYLQGDTYLDQMLDVPPPVRGPNLPFVIQQPEILVKDWELNEFLYYGGFYIPRDRLKHHTLSLGTSGSGKSLLLEISMAWALSHCKKGSGVKVVLFDTKGDFLPIAAHFAQQQQVPLYYLNISDNRAIHPEGGVAGYAWDIAKDCDGRLEYLMEMMEILLPTPDQGDPFWAQGEQGIAIGSAEYYEQQQPGKWGLFDIYNACLARAPELAKILRHTEFGTAIAERLLEGNADKTRDGVLLGVLFKMLHFQTAAAHQYYTPRERWFSIKEFMQGEGIVVISQDLSAKKSSSPIMRAMFQTFVNHYNARPGSKKYPDTFVFMDEFPFIGKMPGILDVLTFQRSKGVSLYLTCQGIEQLMDQYGVYGAETIANNCSFKILCRTESPTTAEWSVKLAGTQRCFESHASTQRTAQGASMGSAEALVERTRFITSDFMDMPDTSPYDGLHYFFLSPFTRGMCYRCWKSGKDIETLRPRKAEVPGMIQKPAQYLRMPSPTKQQAPHTYQQVQQTVNNTAWREEFLNVDDPLQYALRVETLALIEKELEAIFGMMCKREGNK